MIGPAMLVITNDAAVAREVTESVNGSNCRLRVRESIPEAISDIKALPGITLLLLDAALLDGGDGTRLIERARRADLPLLVLFPDGTPEATLVESPGNGADACITRPMHGPTILAWVHMAERLRRILQESHDAAKDRLERFSEPLLRSASLSHAVSGPLQNISAAIDLLELALPEDFGDDIQLQSIRRNVQRAADIVRAASDEARQALKRVGGDA